MTDKLMPGPLPMIIVIAALAIVVAGIVNMVSALDGRSGEDQIVILLSTLGALTLAFALVWVGAWTDHGAAWARVTLLAVGAFLLVDPGFF